MPFVGFVRLPKSLVQVGHLIHQLRVLGSGGSPATGLEDAEFQLGKSTVLPKVFVGSGGISLLEKYLRQPVMSFVMKWRDPQALLEICLGFCELLLLGSQCSAQESGWKILRLVDEHFVQQSLRTVTITGRPAQLCQSQLILAECR